MKQNNIKLISVASILLAVTFAVGMMWYSSQLYANGPTTLYLVGGVAILTMLYYLWISSQAKNKSKSKKGGKK